MDYFKTDWSKKMKTNPTANFLLNNSDKRYEYPVHSIKTYWRDPENSNRYRWEIGPLQGRVTQADGDNPDYKEFRLDRRKPGSYYRYMEKAEFDKNPRYTRNYDERNNENKERYIRDALIGDELEDRHNYFRIGELKPVWFGPSDDNEERYDRGVPMLSFWRNTAPKNLYGTANTFLRSNPFQSIKKQPLQISTPLITFST